MQQYTIPTEEDDEDEADFYKNETEADKPKTKWVSQKSPSSYSTKKVDSVYLIGGGYTNQKSNLSHSDLQHLKLRGENEPLTNTQLKVVIDTELKMRNRVKYLEKAQAKAASKVAIIQKRISHRE